VDKEMWYAHTVEYYLALKKNEILLHLTTLMTLEDIMLSENKPDTKEQTLCDSTLRITWKCQIHRDKK
jgi:hypothetical protein